MPPEFASSAAARSLLANSIGCFQRSSRTKATLGRKDLDSRGSCILLNGFPTINKNGQRTARKPKGLVFHLTPKIDSQAAIKLKGPQSMSPCGPVLFARSILRLHSRIGFNHNLRCVVLAVHRQLHIVGSRLNNGAEIEEAAEAAAATSTTSTKSGRQVG